MNDVPYISSHIGEQITPVRDEWIKAAWNVIDAAREVVANWDQGNLAQSVTAMNHAIAQFDKELP